MSTKKVPSATEKIAEMSPAAPLRRIMALIYELLPITAILLLATALVMPLSSSDHVVAGNIWFQLYLLSVLYLYFVWCWSHGGQTLGMRPWHLFVSGQDQQLLSWRGASVRFLLALLGWLPLGLGHLWMLVDARRRNWHDFAVGSQVVFCPSDSPPQRQQRSHEQQDSGQ